MESGSQPSSRERRAEDAPEEDQPERKVVVEEDNIGDQKEEEDMDNEHNV